MDYFLIFGDPLFKVIPAIIMALLLLLLAWIVAGLARNLTLKILKKLKVEKYTDKLGIADEETGCSLDFFGDLAIRRSSALGGRACAQPKRAVLIRTNEN